MSSSLRWEPITNKGESLSSELKFLLRIPYGSPIGITLNESDIPYLTGLRDAAGEGIKKEIQILITAIVKYGEIKVWEQF